MFIKSHHVLALATMCVAERIMEASSIHRIAVLAIVDSKKDTIAKFSRRRY